MLIIITEPESFFDCFSSLPDPRKDINKKHLMIDIIFITVCAVISGVTSQEPIEDFAIDREEWLRKYISLPNGIPSHDTIRYLFLFLNENAFNKAFAEWVKMIKPKLEDMHIAIDGKTTIEKRFYISNCKKDNEKIAKYIRGHWGIENSFHWVLDMDFNEDQCRKRMKNSAKNIATVRKIALNMLKNEKTYKASIKSKILKAARNTDYLENVLGI